MGTSTSSTQTSTPPEWSVDAYKKAGSEAIDLYNSGVGGNTYSGPTVSDLSGTTMSGVNQLATAGANTDTSATRNALSGIAASATTPSYSEQNLGSMANGSYLASGNPYFNDALKGQLDQTANQVQSQFSGAGRYGSGANTGVLANSLGNIRSSALSDQFNRDSQNMLTANSQMDSSKQAGLNTGLSATNAIGTQDQQQFQNALTGANATLQAGGLLDTQAQKQLTDKVNTWYNQDNQDWTRLGLLDQAAAGSAGNYGTQQGNSSSSNPMAALGAVGSLFGGK